MPGRYALLLGDQQLLAVVTTRFERDVWTDRYRVHIHSEAKGESQRKDKELFLVFRSNGDGKILSRREQLRRLTSCQA